MRLRFAARTSRDRPAIAARSAFDANMPVSALITLEAQGEVRPHRAKLSGPHHRKGESHLGIA
jgi:hypothetical protein